MTKKHYKLIAAAFKHIREEYGGDEILNRLEDEICIVLNDDNPSFSYEKFTDASGRTD